MNAGSDPSKWRNQWKNNEDSSEPEEFSIFVFYSPEQSHHRDANRDCRMIGRKTRTRKEGIEDGFLFEISQSKDKVRSRFINKILNTNISYDTECNSYKDIQCSYFGSYMFLKKTISIQSKKIDRISEYKNISQNRNPIGPKNTGLHPRKQSFQQIDSSSRFN